jgi:hypothetical protein
MFMSPFLGILEEVHKKDSISIGFDFFLAMSRKQKQVSSVGLRARVGWALRFCT